MSLLVKGWRLAGVVVVLVGIAGCARSVADHPEAPAHEQEDEAAVAVRVTPAEFRTLRQTIKALGQCEAPLGKLAMLTPALEGQVHAILVSHGATVKTGQAIVELDPKLPAADYAEKLAVLENAKAALALLQSLPRAEEQRISKLAIDQAGVALERATSILDRMKPLAVRNEASPQQVFDAEKAVQQALLQKQAAEAQYEVSMLGPRTEAIEEAKTRIAIAEQAAKSSQTRLHMHTIRASIDGVVQELTCRVGQTIAAGTPVGEVVDSHQLDVLAWLPSRSAHLVRQGQKAEVLLYTVQAEGEHASEGSVPDDHILLAEVVFVGQVADSQTGNLPVRCLVDNSEKYLGVGQTVGLSIIVNEELKVLSVPAAAIVDLGEGPAFSVVRDGKSTELHPTVGRSHDGWVAVSDTDLEEGEPVIVEGGYNLHEETPVKIVGDESTEQPDHGN